MILDTGASYVSLDLNVFLMLGYSLDNFVGTDLVETANGSVKFDLYEIKSLEICGIVRHNIIVQVYDYLKHGITSNYQGVIGLDFLESTNFTIDMVDNTIAINER